jgi:hypothetical protein
MHSVAIKSIMLSVVILNVIMLIVVMLNVISLNVVVPSHCLFRFPLKFHQLKIFFFFQSFNSSKTLEQLFMFSSYSSSAKVVKHFFKCH